MGKSRTDIEPNTKPNIYCQNPNLTSTQTLKVGSLEHLEQIPTVMVTFVQAIFVLATFIHTRNISALSDPILIKL